MSRQVLRALVVVGVAVLLVAHVLAFQHLGKRFVLSAGAMLLVAALLLGQHVGLFAALHDRIRRRS